MCLEGVCYERPSDGLDAGDGGIDSGVDAGPPVLCAEGCAEWQTCKPTGPATGVCADVAIEAVAPAEGAVVAGTARIIFKFQVTQWDGGVLERESIPVLAVEGGISGPATLNRVGNAFQAEFVPANQLGQQSVTAGWVAVNSTITVNTQSCDVACAEWQECLPTPDGGTCGDLDVHVSIVRPVGLTVGTNAAVTIEATVWRVDGGALPANVPFRTANGLKGVIAPVLPATSFSAVIDGGSQEGDIGITLGWEDGGFVVSGKYTVDATPPTLALVMGSDGGAYQRDAVVPAIVTSNEDVVDAGLTLGGVTMARTAISNCPSFGGTTGAKACFLLDFSQPVLRALDGGFDVGLSGTDAYGNSGPTAGPTLPVTRVRWTATPTAHQVQALAVGSDGTLYVGMGFAATELISLSPASGAVLQSSNPGEVQSLAVAPGAGGDVVYLAFNTSAGSIGAVESTTLVKGSVLKPACEGVPGSRTYSGIALYRASGGTVLAVGSVNSSGYGCVYNPAAQGATFNGTTYQFDAPVVTATGPTTASNIVISTATLTASLLHQDNTTGAWWQPVTLIANGVGNPAVGTALQLGSDTHTVPVGQALFLGSPLVGAGGATADAKLFTVENGNVGGGNLGGTTDKGLPVIASVNEGYVGAGASLVRFNPSDLSATAPSVHTLTSDAIRTSPILGAARPEGGGAEGYAVSKGGTLVVFSQGSNTDTWTAPLSFEAGSSVVTHPAMDCNRATLSRNTGVLYVGDDKGAVKAIVVDSPRLLDGAGVWPKYQRSAGNAGNDDTINFPTNWGGCP
jgi:hypothetical protein